MTTPRFIVFGATGSVGGQLVRQAAKRGWATLAIGRKRDLLDQLPGATLVLDLDLGSTVVINPGDMVINSAHARYTQTIANMCPPDIARYVVLGSTRYLTQYPDDKARDVMAAQAYLDQSPLPWCLLHPTMIYGKYGEQNVQRMAKLIGQFGVLPLPNGGKSLIQPIHAQDVINAIFIATERHQAMRAVVHIAGPASMSYADFIRAIAHASGHSVRIFPLPLPLMQLLAVLTPFVPKVPSVTQAEVRRLMEDKVIDPAEMQSVLGLGPRTIHDGLAQTFDG